MLDEIDRYPGRIDAELTPERPNDSGDVFASSRERRQWDAPAVEERGERRSDDSVARGAIQWDLERRDCDRPGCARNRLRELGLRRARNPFGQEQDPSRRVLGPELSDHL